MHPHCSSLPPHHTQSGAPAHPAAHRPCCTPCATAEGLTTYTVNVNGAWQAGPICTYNSGNNSWCWHARINVNVPGPQPALLVVTDYQLPSDMPAIYDSTGTNVSGSVCSAWRSLESTCSAVQAANTMQCGTGCWPIPSVPIPCAQPSPGGALHTALRLQHDVTYALRQQRQPDSLPACLLQGVTHALHVWPLAGVP